MEYVRKINKIKFGYSKKEEEEEEELLFVAHNELGVVAHAFNPSIQETEAGGFEASLAYRVSSRTTRIHRETCLEKTNTHRVHDGNL